MNEIWIWLGRYFATGLLIAIVVAEWDRRTKWPWAADDVIMSLLLWPVVIFVIILGLVFRWLDRRLWGYKR